MGSQFLLYILWLIISLVLVLWFRSHQLIYQWNTFWMAIDRKSKHSQTYRLWKENKYSIKVAIPGLLQWKFFFGAMKESRSSFFLLDFHWREQIEGTVFAFVHEKLITAQYKDNNKRVSYGMSSIFVRYDLTFIEWNPCCAVLSSTKCAYVSNNVELFWFVCFFISLFAIR